MAEHHYKYVSRSCQNREARETVTNHHQIFSIIDRDLEVDGSLVDKGSLIVKGTVKGTLEGKSVVISEEGTILADAKIETMTIGGRFEGRVETSGQLKILATGRCSGEVVCQDLVVEPGGQLNARVTCLKP